MDVQGFWGTMWLTFQLAGVTTVLLLILGVPIAYGLAQYKHRIKSVFEALISMPLILPPTVLGFYLLVLLSPQQYLGYFLDQHFGLRLIFSFEGLVFGSMIYSLPFMVQPIQAGLENLPSNLTDASLLLGKSRMTTFFSVLLPNIKPALLTGVVLTFAHTVGEFGVILMIGGNIPGVTKVASIAIYDEVEALNYDLANYYALVLLVFSFIILVVVYSINRRIS